MVQAVVLLAEGYEFTDRLTSPYRIAYGHIKSSHSKVALSNIDGSERQELLDRDITTAWALCFCSDGSAMYYYNEQFCKKDLTTGVVRRIEGIPQEAPFDQLGSLKCSPDNRTLLFTQTAIFKMVRGSAPVSARRLCRINTDGTGFRVLYLDSEEYRLSDVVPCWKRGFALLLRTRQTGKDENRHEIVKIDLESGESVLIDRSTEFPWAFALSPEGQQAAWSSHDDGLRLTSLEERKSWRLTKSGTCPAWSPDGKTIAFMNDQHCLCLLNVESGQIQNLAWFEPPTLSYKERKSSYAVAPVWSPDGRMLWFALTQTRKLPPPRSLSERIALWRRRIYPCLHNLNPRRTCSFVSYQHHYQVHKIGILDLCTRQVMLSKGYLYGVAWLPGETQNRG